VQQIGVYVPEQRIDNEPLRERLGIDDALFEKIGVRRRAVKEAGQRTSHLCEQAYRELQSRVEVDAAEIGILCVVTQNPDLKIPHTSAIVHQRLGMSSSCMTFDISQGCAGYAHGLAIVSGLMQQLSIGRALLFTCDPYSEIVNPDDRSTAAIFGDAATVTLLGVGGGLRLGGADFGTSPGSSDALKCDDRLQMDGRSIVLNAAREVPRSIDRVLRGRALRRDEIDLFLLHPGSKHVIDLLRGALGLTEARLPFEIEDIGNTVSSSIPLMLAPRLEKAPPRIILSGFGVGFTWGTCLLERGE
jgi:3-oxoacyl-[acyl-carrier-protein] synthase-3